MNRSMRLGPAALLLIVTVTVVTMMALLSFATTSADIAMSGRFADATKARYRLETEAERFLSLASEGESSIKSADGVREKNASYLFEKERDGYKLELEIERPDANGTYEILSYRITRVWNPDDPMQDVWKGN